MGVLVQNCSCLANDVAKIFDVYWDMGTDNAQIPNKWPEKYATKINNDSPIKVNFNEEQDFLTYFSVLHKSFFEFFINKTILYITELTTSYVAQR